MPLYFQVNESLSAKCCVFTQKMITITVTTMYSSTPAGMMTAELLVVLFLLERRGNAKRVPANSGKAKSTAVVRPSHTYDMFWE